MADAVNGTHEALAYDSVEAVDRQLGRLQAERKELLRLRDTMLADMVGLYDIADLLHSMGCHYSHEDQCSWYYENDRENPWRESAHVRYLAQAQAIVVKSEYSPEQIVTNIRVLKDAGVF